MELCLRTPDGAVTVVDFSYDAVVSDVTAALSKLVAYPVHVGSIAAFQGCDGSERLSATGVADGDEVSVSQPTASERLARFPADRHHHVSDMLYTRHCNSATFSTDMLEHARILAETGHPITARVDQHSRVLTELGGPIWCLGHETWLSDVVREHFLAQPRYFAPYEGERFDWTQHRMSLRHKMGLQHHLPRAIMSGIFYPRCQHRSHFGDVRASLLAETAERWGNEHALCKVASLIPDSLCVIAESTAVFADGVWTYRDKATPATRYLRAQGACRQSSDAFPEIPEYFCVMEDPVPWRRTLYLDVRAIAVAAKHGVSVEQMWLSLSTHMLRCVDKEYPSATRARDKERDTRRWLAACWRLLTLGLDPETRGARGVRGLHLCVRLRSRAGCLVFLAAGADRANVRTIGPCFDAGKECASDCACHAYHSGVARLRVLEAGRCPEPGAQLHDVDVEAEVCDCFYCQDYTCGCCGASEDDDPPPNDPDPWDEKDSRMERSKRLDTWRVRNNRSRATRK